MRCRMCKAKIKKRTKICPECGSTVKHSGGGILAVILAVVILIVGLGIAGWKIGIIVINVPSSGGDRPFEAYIEAADRLTAPGSWTENMNMTASMVLKKGSETTKAKTTMKSSVDITGWDEEDLSSLRLSGYASVRALNQSIAYTMTWQNGKAHYEYTEPDVTSADLEINPMYFNLWRITEDMVVSPTMRGNQITFIVKGEDITRMNLSVVDSLYTGVENLFYGDATVNVTIDETTGKIAEFTMKVPAHLSYLGYDADVDYEITYTYS